MASVKARIAGAMAPVLTNIGEPPTNDETEQIGRMLRMYDACQDGQARLREIMPHTKPGDERFVALVCRSLLIQFAAATATRDVPSEVITAIGSEVVRSVAAIQALPDR